MPVGTAGQTERKVQVRAVARQDIGAQLRQLVTAGWLDKGGHGRGTRYRWPSVAGRDLFDGIAAEEVAGSEQTGPASEQTGPASEHLDGGSEHLDAMLQDGRLRARVPGTRTHPDQAYRKRGNP